MLNDPQLSQEYKIRAITRDLNSEKSKQLREKVEVVSGSLDDRTSIEAALTGVQTVFLMTPPSLKPGGMLDEYNAAKMVADVAIEKGLEYIIFSTLPPVTEISGGKYTKVLPFDAKAKAEQYIRGLPIKSAFFFPGGFMENFLNQPFSVPHKAPDGTWVLSRHHSPECQIPLIDAVGDTGKFVGAILAEPDKYEGETFHAATALYTMDEVAAVMSKATGKTVVFKQVSVEELRDILPFKDETIVSIFIEAYSYSEEFGYFGRQDAEELVSWAVENARGRPSTLEEFFEAHPLHLE